MTNKCKYARFRITGEPAPDIPFGARSVGHHAVPAGWVDSIFTVHYVALYWGIHGTGCMVINGDRLELDPEHIGIYLPGMSQEIYALDHEWEYCWWTMDGPLAESIVKSFGYNAGIHHAGPAPLNQISALESIIQGPGRRNEINAAALAYQILSVAAQHYGIETGTYYDKKLIEAATDIILNSWSNPDFEVDSLAEKLNIHRSTLSRRFRQATGTTLIDYIISIRMQNAISMLQETSLSIKEISHHCGYVDPNYFSKLLKSRTGVSPSDLRKMV